MPAKNLSLATGQWYQLSNGSFVSSKYLSTDKVAVQAPTTNNNSTSGGSTSSSGSSQSSSSSSEGQTVTMGPTGDGSGSSRENRGGGFDNWGGDGAITGGNLQ